MRQLARDLDEQKHVRDEAGNCERRAKGKHAPPHPEQERRRDQSEKDEAEREIRPGTTQANPFWVVRAAKEVIDGHGGVWQDAVPSVYRGPRLPACEGFEAGTSRRGAARKRRVAGRSRGVREIDPSDQTSSL
jgi:hypothetical protein